MKRSSKLGVISMALLLSLTAIASEKKSSSEPTDEEKLKPALEYICNRPGPDVDAQDDVHLALTVSNIEVMLLSGDTQGAAEDLGDELSMNVISLNNTLRHNPCNASKEALARIGPALRVIAAINHMTPIAAIQHNEEILGMLQNAIADDPDHYQKLLERSKKWAHGIR